MYRPRNLPEPGWSIGFASPAKTLSKQPVMFSRRTPTCTGGWPDALLAHQSSRAGQPRGRCRFAWRPTRTGPLLWCQSTHAYCLLTPKILLKKASGAPVKSMLAIATPVSVPVEVVDNLADGVARMALVVRLARLREQR